MSREYSKAECVICLRDRSYDDPPSGDRDDTPRSDSQRWRLVKSFHHLLRLEHWDGHGWVPLYGEAADRIVDELILNSGSTSSTKGTAEHREKPQPPADIWVYKFEQVSCSQCGGEFGPGDHGFSHCENHKHLPRLG